MRRQTFLAASALALLAPGAAIASETISYSYDARGRLVHVARSGTVNNGVSAAYSYDKADNRTNKTSTTGAMAVVIPLNGGTVIPINR